MHQYRTNGTCSTEITFDLIDGRVHNVAFANGCRGNLQGIGRLVEGMEAREVIARCKGVQCHGGTSCPDQLAKALEKALAQGAN